MHRDPRRLTATWLARTTYRWLVATALALAIAACTSRPATELVIRVDTNIPPGELTRVEIAVYSVDRTTAATRFHGTYDLNAADALMTPGDVGVVASDQSDSSRVRIEVIGTVRTGPPLRRTAVVAFQPHRTLLVDMFLAAECESVECGQDRTCGRFGCETVFRTPEDFRPDAAYDSGLSPDVQGEIVDAVALDVPPLPDVPPVPDVLPPFGDVIVVTVDTCVPICNGGRHCGDNGCGGSCGSCGATEACVDGACRCQPDCAGRTCGFDTVCGLSCGECPADIPVCVGGHCCGGAFPCM